MTIEKEIEVYDDVFDDKFILELNDICDQIPSIPNNIANRKTFPYGKKGSHNLFGKVLFVKMTDYVYQSSCPLDIMYAFDHFANKILKKKVELIEISSNLQVAGMDGTSHVDSLDQSTRTVILFTTYNWKKEWGGQFQTLDNNGNVINDIEYVPGRIIYLDSTIPHRGLAPLAPYVFRHSIAYRIRV